MAAARLMAAFWLTERMDADAVRLLAEKAGAPALDEAQTARACAPFLPARRRRWPADGVRCARHGGCI